MKGRRALPRLPSKSFPALEKSEKDGKVKKANIKNVKECHQSGEKPCVAEKESSV